MPVLLWGAVIFIFVFFVATLCPAGEVKETARFSIAPVPLTGKAPKIDGTVEKREWTGATLLPRLIRSEDGAVTDIPSRVYLACDTNHLYIAFQFDRPPNAITPAMLHTERDQNEWEDDCFEMILDPGHGHAACFSFGGNAAGGFWDKLQGPKEDHTQDVVNWAWNPEWQYKARTTDNGWEGEMAIPFATLQRSAPKSGDVWGFDFINRQQTPVKEVSAFSFVTQRGSANLSAVALQSRAKADELNHLLFTGEPLVVRFVEAGPFSNVQGGGATLEIMNPGDQAANPTVSLELFKSKTELGDPSKGYLPGIGNALKQSGMEIILPTTDLSTLIKEQLARYVPVSGEGAKVAQTVAVPSNQSARFRVATIQTGEYLLKYQVRNGEKTLAAGMLPFVLSPPIKLDLKPFFLAPKLLQVKVDLRRTPDWKEKARVKLGIVKKLGEKPIVEIERPYAEKLELFEQLSTEKLEAGGYIATVELLGADGARKALVSAGFSKPPIPDWFTHPVGGTPAVPEPWKPIEVLQKGDRTTLSFLMGNYALADSVWPEQIQVRSIYDEKKTPILRGPMTLKGKVGGTEIVWEKSKSKITIKGKKDEAVNATGKTAAGAFTLSTDVTFEYDGMAKVVMTLAPQTGQTALIDELYLEAPLTKEYSALYLRSPTPAGMKNFLSAGKVPAEGLKHEFVSSVWLGNEERGFRWFAENMKGWRITEKHASQAIEVLNSDQGATLKINLFKGDAPFPLKKERTITMGYMFTPPKTVRRDLIKLATTLDKEYEGKAGVNAVETWFFVHDELQGWPEIVDAKDLQEKLEFSRKTHQVGMKLTPYSGWFLSRRCKVYPIFGGEMTTEPVANAYLADVCCWNTPVQDVYAAQFQDRIKDLDLDGFRLDAGFTAETCTSLAHTGYGSTCGWVDDNGNVQPSRALFAARRAAQRVYRLFHGGVKTGGTCVQHVHQGNRYDPILSNMDAVLSCEGAELKMKNLSELPLDFYRANVMGDQHGYQVVYLPKAEEMGVDVFYGLALLHNFTPRGGYPVAFNEVSYSRAANSPREIWRAREWIGPFDKGTEFWGYWKNEKLLQTGDPALVGSFHVRRGEKLLLGILDTSRKPVEGKVRLDLKALGFSGKVYAFDPILGEPIAVDLPTPARSQASGAGQAGGDAPADRGAGTLTLAFTPEGYRLIQIASKPFDVFEPQKESANLIPESEPSNWALDGPAPPGWTAAKWIDEKNPLEFTKNDVSVKGSVMTLTGDGQTNLRFYKTFGAEGKKFLLEVEACIECDDGVFLGPSPAQSQFSITFGDIYVGHKRTMTSQELPGHTQKFRLYGEGPCAIDIWLRKAKGKAIIKKLEMYEVKNLPPGFQVGRYGQ
ncbi:MAG: hypothetical protein HY360_25730 [Verrucomicrobia bacterium]|nr:hypothetical protein [Verrucomicrobiota bacterium]